jgi:hypothetical protein
VGGLGHGGSVVKYYCDIICGAGLGALQVVRTT